METDNNKEIDETEDLKTFVEENRFKIRNCENYLQELRSCTSMQGRFHQYFVHGEFADCSSWQEDAVNCKKPIEDFEAHASIIRHEDERRRRRIQSQVANDVCKKRSSPPSNWNCELPEYIQKKVDESFTPVSNEENSCIIS